MKIQLDHQNAKMPHRAHTYDAGADLHALYGGVIPAKGHAVFDTGVHVVIPESCAGIVKGRSGLAFRHQIICHEGTVDCGYTGSIQVILFNMGDTPYQVEAGDRIAQLVVQPVLLCPFEQVDGLRETDRGSNGFGSSGK